MVVLLTLYRSVGTSAVLGVLVSPDDEENGCRSGNTLELNV